MVKLGIKSENIRIIYNGIDEQFKPDFTRKKENLIVYLGRIKKYKQLDHLIKAFSIVKKQTPDAKLTIAGKGDFQEIKELSDKLNLKLDIINDITEKEKVALLQRAKVFVTPSIKEGWGLTVIEANSCAAPVVAYDVPGLRDSVKNNATGFLVEPGNIEGLALAVMKVLEENGLHERLSKNALEWSKNFSWDKSAELFEGIIEDDLLSISSIHMD
jgi:glycosyltransferase involved in cell wall biosynthesis